MTAHYAQLKAMMVRADGNMTGRYSIMLNAAHWLQGYGGNMNDISIIVVSTTMIALMVFGTLMCLAGNAMGSYIVGVCAIVSFILYHRAGED